VLNNKNYIHFEKNGLVLNQAPYHEDYRKEVWLHAFFTSAQTDRRGQLHIPAALPTLGLKLIWALYRGERTLFLPGIEHRFQERPAAILAELSRLSFNMQGTFNFYIITANNSL
jgi:hypothetical protein